MGDRRECAVEHQALGQPGADKRATQDDDEIHPQEPPEERHTEPFRGHALTAARLMGGRREQCLAYGLCASRFQALARGYQRNSTVPDGLGGLAPAAIVEAWGS